MQPNQIIEFKLIDELIVKRQKLIDSLVNSYQSTKVSIQLADEINHLIPILNPRYHDSLSAITFSVATRLGENTKNRISPMHSQIMNISDDSLLKTITKVIDSELWISLYNRLGVFSILSEKQISELKTECKTNPLEFNQKNISASLKSIYLEKDDILINSLFNVLFNLPNAYSSNTKKEFNKKIIFEDVLNSAFISGVFLVSQHSDLYAFFSLIWRWAICHKELFHNGFIPQNDYWSLLTTKLKQAKTDWDEVKNIDIYGIKVTFYKKGTAHVLLPDHILYALNDCLRKSKYLSKDL